ncbi:uncharacterized protein [Battus philenor]|uniref:uncharacterized protein n=1 Tax=Battus philenor TaxID=42288 RepID=UPI0035D05A27
MKQNAFKNNSYKSDDELIRYKINTHYNNNAGKSSSRSKKKLSLVNDDDSIRYKLRPGVTKTKEKKTKPKIKVNFWSNKQSRLHNVETKHTRSVPKHRPVAIKGLSPKLKSTAVTVRKQVSFLPSPLFSDAHVPMVTVPDDLTIQLNEEEANDLREDLNLANVNSIDSTSINGSSEKNKRKTKTCLQTINKHKRSLYNEEIQRANENELEFFSKYIVQKLRKMETNQRIYSENLINTVLMLGQLAKLNGKSKISEA